MAVTADILRSKFGFNDPNVINGILNNPAEVARYEREMGGGSSSGGGGYVSPQEYADAVLKAQEQQRKEETSYIQKAFLDNPFVFDEEAARKASTAEYAPYYQNLLEDYLKGVELKRENLQDERQLLDTLKKMDLASRSRASDYAVEKAEQGYAGQGMFFSGLKERAVGRLGIESQAGTQEALAKYGAQERGYGREEQGLNLEQNQTTEEYTNQKNEAIEGGILQRRGEQQKAYYEPRVQQYMRLYPTGGSTLAGYVPQDYLRY